MSAPPVPTVHTVITHARRGHDLAQLVLAAVLAGSLLGGCIGWLIADTLDAPAIALPAVPPTGTPSPPPTRSGPLLVVVATEVPPTATATVRPLPTYSPMAVCWPGPGTATPIRGQTCYQPLPPLVPATERPSPTCTARATPGTLCVWEGVDR